MEETQSLKNLKEATKDIAIDTIGIRAAKLKIKPTYDVLEFIKNSNNLNWEVVGKRLNNEDQEKPIYSQTISILKK